jgi:chromosome segregation ATPase
VLQQREALEQLQLAEKKWEEEREQLKHQSEDLRRQKDEASRKLQILQEQNSENNSRFDSMIDDLKSQGNGTRKIIIPTCLFYFIGFF